jgi:hypothetical protein
LDGRATLAGNNKGPKPDADQIPDLQRGHNLACRQCDRPVTICARNPGRDRADESDTHYPNKNENLKAVTERDPGKKANNDG